MSRISGATIGELRRKGESYIVELLTDESVTPEDRWQFQYLYALDPLVTQASTPALALTITSKERSVRVQSIDLLTKIGGEQELEVIASALSSADPDTALHAAFVLSRVPDRSVLRRFLPQLVQCLDSTRTEKGARWQVVRAIASTRSPDAVAVLARCALERSRRVRRHATVGLYRIGTPDCRLALEDATRQLSFIKRRYARRAARAGLRHPNEGMS